MRINDSLEIRSFVNEEWRRGLAILVLQEV